MVEYRLIITKRTESGDRHVVTISSDCDNCLLMYVTPLLDDPDVIHLTKQRIVDGKITLAAGLK